jgi:hypothetical protein
VYLEKMCPRYVEVVSYFWDFVIMLELQTNPVLVQNVVSSQLLDCHELS